MPTRLNARIDAELAAKIERIRQETEMSVTDIVRVSVEEYYERFAARQAGRAQRVLEATGFVACGEADEDLSAHDKTLRATALSDKVRSGPSRPRGPRPRRRAQSSAST